MKEGIDENHPWVTDDVLTLIKPSPYQNNRNSHQMEIYCWKGKRTRTRTRENSFAKKTRIIRLKVNGKKRKL